MAVSKRLRYEVLRRDNHACRYCGATPPDVKLNVDHVVPAALGGSNAPTNLVAACTDCNAGKTSSMPNAATVEDVDQQAFRQAAVLKQAATVVDNADTHRLTSSHDPETGHPTSWSFRDVELALVEDAWHTAWCAVDPEGPPMSAYEAFGDQSKELASRGVYIGNMLAAAVMAGAQKSAELVWGVPSRVDYLSTCTDDPGLGYDAIIEWEASWEATASGRPTQRDMTLFCEELVAAIRAGHERHAVLAAAKAAGRHHHFYLNGYLPDAQAVGGDA